MYVRWAADKVYFLLVLCVCSLLPDTALALEGRVVGIVDGDTLTILTANNLQYRVRLSEIDAPERQQAFGTRSRQHLSELCFNKQAVVQNAGKDRYQRILGRVHCNDIDVNLDQVRLGMAWRYVSYSKDPLIESAEQEARNARIGLWSEPKPIPPWEWRKKRKSAVK